VTGYNSFILLRSDKERKQPTDSANVDVEELIIIRFAEFIHDKILNRKIPDKLLDSDPPPAVIAKMDIENEEYSVLTDLLSDDSSLFCALTAISIEYHYYHPQSKKVINVPQGAAQGHFKNLVEIKSLIKQATHQPDCHTNVVQYDSEDYRMDHEEGLQKLNFSSNV
jgi:hypothetical protein